MWEQIGKGKRKKRERIRNKREKKEKEERKRKNYIKSVGTSRKSHKQRPQTNSHCLVTHEAGGRREGIIKRETYSIINTVLQTPL